MSNGGALNREAGRRHSKVQHGSEPETTRQATQSKGIDMPRNAPRSSGAAENGEAVIWR